VVTDAVKENQHIDEIREFLGNPGGARSQQLDRLAQAAKIFMIETTVVEARYCRVGHRVGDRLLFDVHGRLQSPPGVERLCVYLVSQLSPVIARINEKLMQTSGFDDLYFLQYTHCPDVGVENLGYGLVVVRTRIIPKIR